MRSWEAFSTLLAEDRSPQDILWGGADTGTVKVLPPFPHQLKTKTEHDKSTNVTMDSLIMVC